MKQERSQPWHQSPRKVRSYHRQAADGRTRRQEDLPLSSQKQRQGNGGMSLSGEEHALLWLPVSKAMGRGIAVCKIREEI